jgi:hypothetical protein
LACFTPTTCCFTALSPAAIVTSTFWPSSKGAIVPRTWTRLPAVTRPFLTPWTSTLRLAAAGGWVAGSPGVPGSPGAPGSCAPAGIAAAAHVATVAAAASAIALARREITGGILTDPLPPIGDFPPALGRGYDRERDRVVDHV